MKIYMSEISFLLNPESIKGEGDRELSARIRESVGARTGLRLLKSRKRQTLRLTAAAAIIAALLSITAYAAVRYSMSLRRPSQGETVSGQWTEAGGHINISEYPDAGLCLSFSYEGERGGRPEFLAGWLPVMPQRLRGDQWEKTGSGFKTEVWLSYLTNDGSGAEIPYNISIRHAERGMTYVLNGKPGNIKEFNRDGWQIIELQADYSENSSFSASWDRANYIFAFNEEKGWLLQVKGTSDMETLEKIAENLEIREGSEPPENMTEGSNICILDIGRG